MKPHLSRISTSHRAVLIAVASVVALALAAGAAAYLTSTGSGAGSAQVGTASAVTISPGSPTSALYPGGSADVAATIANPNSTQVHIPLLALDTSQGTAGFSVDGSHSGCSVSALQFTAQNNSGGGWDVSRKVGATDGTLSVDLPGAISMSADAANACQGATFTVYLKVGP